MTAVMYASYFGLCDQPFNATSDARFLYMNRACQDAYRTLLSGIRERKELIALTGEVGTGKTTLVRRLMGDMDPAVKVIYVSNTTLTFDELVELVCVELGLSVTGLSRSVLLRALRTFLISEAARGGRVVLLLDEAQNLSAEVLENLQLISNLGTPTADLVQVVLVGQPELEVRFADPALQHVAQRIAIRHRLERLRDPEVEPFIDHRLRVAGRQRRDLFTDEAIQRLVPCVNGIPRLINAVCDNALLLAYGADAKQVTGPMIEDVLTDLRLNLSGPPPVSMVEQRRLQRAELRSLAVTSAGGAPWSRACVACLAALALVGIVLAGIGDRLGASWDRRSPFRTAGMTTVGESVRPAPVSAAALTSASGKVGHTGERPAAAREIGEVIGRILTIPPGETISKIAFKHYGHYSFLGLDLIQEMNPEIRDVNVVRAGQPLWLPPLNLDALLHRDADDSYRIIVTSQPGFSTATEIAESVRKHGYSVVVTRRKVASGDVLFRVEIAHLKTRLAAIRAWEDTKRFIFKSDG